MEEITAIVVDDEIQNVKLLKILLAKYGEHVRVINEASSLTDALVLIKEEKPDIVFMDIEMPDHKGIELFKYFSNPKFMTVFTTAHHFKFIETIQKAGFTYLLKPLDVRKIKEIIGEVQKHGIREFYPTKNQIDCLKKEFDLI